MAVHILTSGGGGTIPLSHARILWNDLIHLPETTLTGDTPEEGFTLESLRYPTTYEGYKPEVLPASIGAEWDDLPADGVLIAGHNLGSTGCSVEVTLGEDTIMVTPEDNSPIFIIFDRPPETTNGVEIEITGETPPIISVVMVGQLLAMERPIFVDHAPTELNVNVVLGNQKSIAGQALGFSVRRVGADTTYSWKNLTREFLYGSLTPFKNYAETGRGYFAIAWRPSFQPLQLGRSPGVQFGSLTGTMSSKATGQPDYFDLNFNVSSAGPIR